VLADTERAIVARPNEHASSFYSVSDSW